MWSHPSTSPTSSADGAVMAIIAIMGPGGAGKTEMAGLTSPRTPVHFIDIDRKIRSTSRLHKAIAAGQITYREVGESIIEGNLNSRLSALIQSYDNPDKEIQQATRPPAGWSNFANYVGQMETDVIAQNAKTIVLDSATQLQPHLRAHIQFQNKKSKYVFDDWAIWQQMWMETISAIIDYCLTCQKCKKIHQLGTEYDHENDDKDFIMILHERVSEKPTSSTRKVTITLNKGVRQRSYVGDLDVLIAGSIDGAFGLNFGTFFTDVYALRVALVGDTPKWICRVLPDGQRDLRCSFDVKGQAEWVPDFRQIRGLASRVDPLK
jgi:hypothetical protein